MGVMMNNAAWPTFDESVSVVCGPSGGSVTEITLKEWREMRLAVAELAATKEDLKDEEQESGNLRDALYKIQKALDVRCVSHPHRITCSDRLWDMHKVEIPALSATHYADLQRAARAMHDVVMDNERLRTENRQLQKRLDRFLEG